MLAVSWMYGKIRIWWAKRSRIITLSAAALLLVGACGSTSHEPSAGSVSDAGVGSLVGFGGIGGIGGTDSGVSGSNAGASPLVSSGGIGGTDGGTDSGVGLEADGSAAESGADAEEPTTKVDGGDGGEIIRPDPAPMVLVPAGSRWRYLDDGRELGQDWVTAEFDDSAWSSGPAELGYGDGDESTTVGYGPNAYDKHMTTYFRHHFAVSDPSSVAALSLSILRDDGAVVYLNGVEVYRTNLPDNGKMRYDVPALSTVARRDEETFHTVDVAREILVAGTNVLAVEVHQSSRASNDLSFDLQLAQSPQPIRVRTGEWTLVALPDTQMYVEYKPEIFTAQTRWIVEHREALNIQMVVHEGDIVQWNTPSEWELADASMSLLIDADIPLTMAPGDHDRVGQLADGSTELFYQTFPESRFNDDPWWGGDYNDNTNHFVLLTVARDDYLFLGLDFCPSHDELEWADGVLSTHADRKAIVTTHALIDDYGNYYGTSDCGRYLGDTSYIWEGLLRNHDNVQLVLCGHMHWNDGEYHRTVINRRGVPVHQVLADYQGREQGGAGLLRIMTFDTWRDEIRVQTYSPYTGTYENDDDSEFSLPYEMTMAGRLSTRP
ncbi:MAG: metallophosphoesterase [Deltaproteobacteria bacterium]|nr:metallophosphoesterase [Deltaproteobacteria bacterium]